MLEKANPTHCKNTHVLKGGVKNPYDPDMHICLESVPTAGCVVYSFGIDNMWEFDDFMHSKGCNVFSFDPSMDTKKHWRNPNHLFEPIGIGVKSGIHIGRSTLFTHKNGYPVETLRDIMKRHNHTHISILRMDTEGAEWDVLDQWIATGMFDHIDQMLVEVHIGPPPLGSSTRAIHTLGRIPLRLHYGAYNPHSVAKVEAWEVGFVRPNRCAGEWPAGGITK
jgi:hypothetical protein